MPGGFGIRFRRFENMTPEDLPDIEQRKAAHDEIAPFVCGGNKCTEEATDHKNPCHENGSEDVGQREASGEKEFE